MPCKYANDYVKKSDYWEKDIFSIRSTKRQDILAEIKEADNTPNQINLKKTLVTKIYKTCLPIFRGKKQECAIDKKL